MVYCIELCCVVVLEILGVVAVCGAALGLREKWGRPIRCAFWEEVSALKQRARGGPRALMAIQHELINEF